MNGFMSALKISENSDLFLGIFIILEGICLIFNPSLFPICIIIGTVIGFAWLIELIYDIIKGKKRVRSLLQQMCILIVLLVSGFFLVLMLIDSRLSLNIDRIAVCSTTIIDGVRSLIDAIRYEKRIVPKIIICVLCLVYINYGLVYSFMGGDGLTSFFTTGMHGVVFICLGLTDIWFYYLLPFNRRLPKSDKNRDKKK